MAEVALSVVLAIFVVLLPVLVAGGVWALVIGPALLTAGQLRIRVRLSRYMIYERPAGRPARTDDGEDHGWTTS